jgi:RNA polymerase sigma-70 factor (ECF subfamily)
MLRRTERKHDPGPEAMVSAADVDAARRRDPAAVARVYKAYAPGLYRFFMASLGDRHTAEDLVATVFAAAIDALPGFRGPAEALGGWLFRIARHDLADHRRRLARHPTERLDDRLEEAAAAEAAPDPEDLAVLRLTSRRVLATLGRLSADQREVLLLRVGAGLSTAEVAAAVGKTVGAVKALQHRGLSSLARLVADELAES